MRAVVRQPPVGILQQADQVEQRGDVRVGLAVVVAEQPFVVADQAGVDVRGYELPVVAEPLRRREFDRTVVAAGVTEAPDRRVAASGLFRGARVLAARIEEEVDAAVVERTVLDDVSLPATLRPFSINIIEKAIAWHNFPQSTWYTPKNYSTHKKTLHSRSCRCKILLFLLSIPQIFLHCSR